MEKQKEKIRLSDVARLAGVSRSAAGKVLNGCCGDIRVGAATRRRIEEAACRLNYRTNMAAAMLAGRESNLIGVIVDAQTRFRNMQLLQEIERIAFRRRYRLMVSFTHDNISDMRENYHAMQRYGVVGVICLAHDYPQFRNEISDLFRNVSDVIFMEKPYFDAPGCIRTDNREALTELFAHLKHSGRKKIALAYGNPIHQSESMLLENYRAALSANGITFLPELLGQYPDNCTTLECCEYLIEHFICRERPDALFVDDATFAICIQSRLQYFGWRIPEELILCGGNNDPLFRHAMPEIRSLDPHYEQIATELLEAVLWKDYTRCKTIQSTFQ